MKTRGLKIILMVLVAVAGLSAVVMLLWNALIPGIFGLVAINYWQALGLLVLARILFGGFRGHGRMMGHGMRGGNPIHDKWMKMSPEQKKEFLKRRREHMGMFGRGDFFDRGGFDFEENDESKRTNE